MKRARIEAAEAARAPEGVGPEARQAAGESLKEVLVAAWQGRRGAALSVTCRLLAVRYAVWYCIACCQVP
jgi:hypothetical protein